jgi:hypothetical protein
MWHVIQQTAPTKLLVGIVSLLLAAGILLAGMRHANQQTAAAARELAGERDRAAQDDQQDKAAVEKIRERNRQ